MKKILAVAAMVLAPSVANAGPIYLDFENIAPYPNNNNVTIGGYYNGGTSSIGTSGTNYGVEFTSGATLLCLNTAGTSCSNTSRGGQGISTSQFGALYFPSAGASMNVAAGFDTGFAGVYSNPNGSATTVSIYSGLNGTGTLLATTSLGATGAGTCNSNISSGALYCPFESFSLGFSGTAMSVVFGGTVNQQVFDDFTFGSTVVGGNGAVPEPATWAMMMLGFGAMGGMLRRRKAATQRVRFAV